CPAKAANQPQVLHFSLRPSGVGTNAGFTGPGGQVHITSAAQLGVHMDYRASDLTRTVAILVLA
ncbi:hypothetical protein, partial [Mycobacterium marinum]|uniref:hypothetical protein n=1 Tax=Mycobacterium marinum TaxID=1781 RepID=UPI00356516AF